MCKLSKVIIIIYNNNLTSLLPQIITHRGEREKGGFVEKGKGGMGIRNDGFFGGRREREEKSRLQ